MFLNKLLHLFFATQACLIFVHGHFQTDNALQMYKRRYAKNHRELIINCGQKVLSRQLKRAMAPPSSLHPSHRNAILAQNLTSGGERRASSCVLDGEVTQGPYHVMGELIRQNISEGLAGIPVTYEVDFVDWSTCEPLKYAWVDLWHANSTGYYSGFTAEGASTGSSGVLSISMSSNATVPSASSSSISATSTNLSSDSPSRVEGISAVTLDNLSFDRGIWKTDEDGHLTMFSTIPGWYVGRAVHSHIKVYDESSGYQATNGTFVANSTAYHTGQWFYPQEFLAQLADLEPYSLNALTYNDSTKNEDDTIYPDAAANGNVAEMTLAWIDHNNLQAGVVASTVVGVNLTYSSAETSSYYWTGNITLADSSSGIESNDSATDSSASALPNRADKFQSSRFHLVLVLIIVLIITASAFHLCSL